MVHFTFCGGSEIKLNSHCKLIFTMFGGTDVQRPTLAKRIMQEKAYQEQLQGFQEKIKKEESKTMSWWERMMHAQHQSQLIKPPHRSVTLVLTICGAVEFHSPSIAEEFIDMRELIQAGVLSKSQWDQLVGHLFTADQTSSLATFTLMGGMDEQSLDDEEQVKKIQSAKELGLISIDEERALRSVVGKDPKQVLSLLRDTAIA